jgi:PAS domain S-box-containing protein
MRINWKRSKAMGEKGKRDKEKSQKENQKQTIEQEDFSRYKAVFDNIEESYVEVDLAGNISFFNESLRRALGYSAEELMGMNYRQYVSDKDIERVYKFYYELYLTGIPGKLLDYEVITKDGSRGVFEISASLIRDSSGKPIKFRSLARDITDRKRSEEELQRSEEKYRSILENIEDGYFELDLAGNMTFFNAAMCRIVNVSTKELLGMNNREYTSPETAKEMFRVFNEIFTTGKPATLKEYEIIWKDGSRRNLELSVSLMRDQVESPIGFRGIARDVTEKKRSEEMYRTVAEKSFAGVYIVQRGIFQYINANVAAC